MAMFLLLLSSADTSVLQLLESMRDARAGLTQYHISGSHSRTNHGPDRLTESYDFEIWRDGDRIRCDQFDKPVITDNPHHRAQFNTRSVLCVNCVKPGYAVRYRDGSGVAILPKDHLRLGKLYISDIAKEMIDIMAIGVDNELQSYKNSPNYQIVPGSQYHLTENSSSRLVVTHKVQPIRLTYNVSGRTITSIDTAVGTTVEDKYLTSASFEESLNPYGLPTRITYRSTTKNKPYATIEQTFQYHSLAKPIDASVFTLPGLRIKDGTVVDDGVFKGGTKFVFGGKIRSDSAMPAEFQQAAADYQKLQPGPVAVDPQPRRTWLYVVACVTLAAFGVVVLRKAIRRV